MNPFPTAISIKQDTTVGNAEPIDGTPHVLFQQEDETAETNFHKVRRVNFAGRTEAVKQEHEVEIGRNLKEGQDKSIPDHLKDLFQRSTVELSDIEKEKVADLLGRYQDTFSCNEWDIGLTHLTEHAIKTEGKGPVRLPPRRVPLAHADKEKQAIEDMKAKGVIRESVSPWASPICLVSKKDGGVRLCVDYRKVNELVKPDGFPLPRVQDCLDAVAGSKWFSSFDLTSGYYQIGLKDEDIPKSAFVCKYGHYEMTRMPFGLNSAASTFQRTMELALQGLQWITCLIYIDDIIVYGRNFEEHIARVEEVLERIKTAGLKLKPNKSNMFQTSVVFLGHVVSKEGVKPNPANIAKVVDWPQPKTAKQIRQFVALGSYYRRFVKDYASMVKPMVELTKKGKRFNWDETCDSSFQAVKKALISADVMGYPLNEAGEFILDVDASDLGIGAVLHQVQGDRERVIAYASRAMNRAERNYCITEKELLAVRFFIEHFRQYLLGRKFLVRTDHQALVWLFKLKEPRGKIARWIEILSHYDFSIEYRPGRKQTHCDALSRCENPRECDCPNLDTSEPLKCGPCKKCMKRAQDMLHESLVKESILFKPQEDAEKAPEEVVSEEVTRGVVQDEEIPGTSTDLDNRNRAIDSEVKLSYTTIANLSAAEVSKYQKDDPDIGPILEAKLSGKKPTSQEMVTKSPTCRHYWIIWDSLEVRDGILYKKFLKRDGTGSHTQLVVPLSLRKQVLHQTHDSLLSGHLGCKKTKQKILQKFYWYALKEDVNLHICRCDTCQADKKPLKVPRASLGSLAAGAPGDCLATDYLGPFPVTPRGNRYILLLTDHFSKYVEIIPVPNMTAEVCASKILNEYIARWGCPLSIHSDQGRTYESQIFKELCRMLEIRKTRTSVRNPKGNGQSERFNRTLLRMIRAYLCDEQGEWDLHLGCLAGAYRATPHEATKMTPNLLTMGREVRLPAELLFGSTCPNQEEEITSYGDYVDILRSRMQHAHEVARKYLAASAKRNKDLYDVKKAVNSYKKGDLVWYLLEKRKVGEAPKLNPAYHGPFLVKQKVNEVDFLIQLDKEGKEQITHHDKLKPYEGVNPPRWVQRAKKRLLAEKHSQQ
ncbi:MAG: DDE-type integrase/transposase/recombinase [Candidatus Thiodiazotropha taylori]|nr:DDE-type integrase/transposase/recombinase [Candidatus Thiodiazotropha taylori]